MAIRMNPPEYYVIPTLLVLFCFKLVQALNQSEDSTDLTTLGQTSLGRANAIIWVTRNKGMVVGVTCVDISLGVKNIVCDRELSVRWLWSHREPTCSVHQAETAFLSHYNINARAFVTVSVGLLHIYVFCASPNESVIGSDYVTSNDEGKLSLCVSWKTYRGERV